jgi:hypothetical protein
MRTTVVLASFTLFLHGFTAQAQNLNATEQNIVSEIRKRLPYHLQLLQQLVNVNSG